CWPVWTSTCSMLGLPPWRLYSLIASQMAATFMKFGRAPTTEMILKAIAHLALRACVAPGCGQHVRHRAPGKISEQARELGFRSLQVVVMPELGAPAGGDPGLVGIDLPGMQVDHGRLFFLRVDPADGPRRKLVGKKPEVAAAGHGQIDAARGKRRGRKFDKAPALAQLFDVREARRIGHAVIVVMHRKDARVVFEAQLGQNIQRPERLRGDRIARRTIAEDRRAELVLEESFGAPYIGAKVFFVAPVDP